MKDVGSRTTLAVAMILLALGATGCFGNSASPFPEGLELLEENEVPAPTGSELTMTFGFHQGYDYGHGRFLLPVSAGKTWAALYDPNIVLDVRNTARADVELNAAPEYEHSFKLSYMVDEVINIEWDELWRFGVGEGTTEAPEQALIRYQKVWGSDFIELLEGSILVIAVAADSTDVQFIQHLDAFGAGTDDIGTTFETHHANLLQALGLPAP